ncbi:MAG: response regulator [Ignavibacteriales bacterium]
MYKDEIIKQFHPGFIVRTSLSNSEDFHYNIIHSIYGDTLILLNYKNSNIIGQEIIIKANASSAEYILTASVLDINNSEPQTIKAKILDCIKYNENRRYERYLTKFGSNIKVEDDKIGVFSIVQNISSSGAYAVTSLDIPLQSQIKLDLIHVDGEEISTINASIIRKIYRNENFGYGLIFSKNHPVTINKISTIIENAEKFKFKLYEEWQKSSNVLRNLQESTGIKALIVDDIKFTRICLKTIFENCGISNILEASNGSDAIEKIESYNPDIVTLDISMPGIDGIETVKHISTTFPLDRIIIVSALIDNESINALKELGITKFIPKPFSNTQVIDEIKKIFPEVSKC